MRNRGGGILEIKLVDKTAEMPNYYQLKASFDTVDSMEPTSSTLVLNNLVKH